MPGDTARTAAVPKFPIETGGAGEENQWVEQPEHDAVLKKSAANRQDEHRPQGDETGDMKSRLPAFILWGTFLLLTGGSLHYFYSSLTLDWRTAQAMDPALLLRPRSLMWAAILLVPLTLVVWFLSRRLPSGVTVALVPAVLVLVTGHGEALLGLALMCGGGLCLGGTILGRIKPKDSWTFFDIVLAFYTGLGANAYLTWTLMHWPVNYIATYVLLYLAELIVFRRVALAAWAVIRPAASQTLTRGRGTCLILSTMLLVYALVPTYGGDEMVKHLYIPTYVAQHHVFTFDPVNHLFGFDTSIIPLASYVSAYLTGGEFAVRMLNWLLVILTGWLILEKGTQWFDRRTGAFAMVTAFLTPVLLWVTALVLTDSFLLMASTLAIIYAVEYLTSDADFSAALRQYGLVVPLLLLSKQGGLLLILVTLPLLFIKAVSDRRRRQELPALRHMVLAIVLIVTAILPVLIHNYVITGNPVFPFYNRTMRSPYFPPTDFHDTRWNQPLQLNSLFEMTFHGRRFSENMDYSVGLSYFVFLPFIPLAFAFANSGQRRTILILALVSLLSVIAQFKLGIPYLRYFAGLLLPTACLVGVSWTAILGLGRHLVLRLLSLAAVTLVIGANAIAVLSSQSATPQPFPIVEALTHNYEHSSLQEWLNYKKLFDYINMTRSPEAKCLVFTRSLSFLSCRADLADWAHPSNNLAIAVATTPDEAYDTIFKKLAYDVVVLPDKIGIATVDAPAFRNRLRTEFRINNLSVCSPIEKTR